MNKIHILIILIGILYQSNLQAQSDRFIRIYGVASQEVISEDLRIYISVFEIEKNEKRGIQHRSFKESYNGLISQLRDNGFSTDRLILAPKEIKRNYPNKISATYYVDIKSTEDVSNLSFQRENGYVIDKTLFIFDEIQIESQLSVEAVKDAKKKAVTMCKDLGLKLGKIRSIEDQSSGCCDKFLQEKTSKKKLEYKVTVTFELLD